MYLISFGSFILAEYIYFKGIAQATITRLLELIRLLLLFNISLAHTKIGRIGDSHNLLDNVEHVQLSQKVSFL